jgi:uncharacterized SAM-binding protein YcdF (DUF218 family)
MTLEIKSLYLFFKKYWILALIGLILSLVVIVPIKNAIAIYQAPVPQAFLVLGGDPKREEAVAEIANWYPKLDIWVSSGPNAKETMRIFQNKAILPIRLHIDQRAVDTVTNFTTLVKDFQKTHIQHLFLVTSDYHMPRAKAIASLVLGSHGIVFTPLSVPSNQPPESSLRILRDIIRSLVWLFTGYTSTSV